MYKYSRFNRFVFDHKSRCTNYVIIDKGMIQFPYLFMYYPYFLVSNL